MGTYIKRFRFLGSDKYEPVWRCSCGTYLPIGLLRDCPTCLTAVPVVAGDGEREDK
jgi:hypothetical protein